MKIIRAVLFDLDGTLVDTAPDLLYALNQLRKQYDKSPLPLSAIRPLANQGSKAMLKFALGVDENATDFKSLREQFFALYQIHLADATQFFPHIERVLAYLDEQSIPWGIVTNKLTRHATALLQAMQWRYQPACLICGDSLPTQKPDPAPIRVACERLQQLPAHCLYIGDAESDVIASRRAGTQSLVALYGYINEDENPLTWQADGYIETPLDILSWIAK